MGEVQQQTEIMKNLLFILFMGMVGFQAKAQKTCNLSINGVITDRQSKEALAYASVYVFETKGGAQANENGEFSISGLCPGHYTLKIEHLGCHPSIKKIDLSESIQLNFQLDHGAHDLHEIQVNAQRERSSTGQQMTRLEGLQLKQKLGENLGNTLSQLSGVTVLQTGSTVAKPVIHGMHSNRVLILNNGIRQEGQQWGAEHAPEIDPFIAKRISVIKGANAIKYGPDAIGGVILVEPSLMPDSSGVFGELNLSGASNGRMGATSGQVEGNFRGLKFRGQGTLKLAGNMRTPDHFMDNTGLEEQNFSTALAYGAKKWQNEFFYSRFNTSIGIFSGAHLGNTSDLIRSYNGENPSPETDFTYTIGRPKQHIAHELTKLKSTFKFNNFNSLSLVYSRQYNRREEFDRHPPKNDSLAALNRPEFQYHITTHLVELEYNLHHHNHFEGSLGIQGMTQANTYNGRYFIPNYRNRSIGLFWVERFHTGKWQFESGLRFDYRHLQVFKPKSSPTLSPVFEYHNPSASLGVNYRLKEWLTISAFSGTAWRAPAPNELFSNGLHHGSATVEIGDPNLKTESTWNNNLSLKLNREKLSAELSLYHNLLHNFINLVPSGQNSLTIRGAFPSYVYIQQNAIFKGIDAEVEWKTNQRTSISGQYNMVRAKDTKTGDFIALVPADNIRLGLSYQLPLKKENSSVRFDLRLNYVARQTRYPKEQVLALENGTTSVVSDFAPPPADYFLVEPMLTLEYAVAGKPLTLSVGATNLLNKRYRNYLNRFRYFTDEAGTSVQIRLCLPFNIIKY